MLPHQTATWDPRWKDLPFGAKILGYLPRRYWCSTLPLPTLTIELNIWVKRSIYHRLKWYILTPPRALASPGMGKSKLRCRRPFLFLLPIFGSKVPSIRLKLNNYPIRRIAWLFEAVSRDFWVTRGRSKPTGLGRVLSTFNSISRATNF